MSPSSKTTDVAIMGGGLAGLSLAIQLRQRDPSRRVTVLERQRHPVPEGAFKVGESTVEIGAHYFSHVLGLRDHLDAEQIRKFGFRFYFSEARQAVDRCTEIGFSAALPMPSWQLDRGRFENFLGTKARELGVEFLDGAVVRGFQIADDDAPHSIRFELDGQEHALHARWLVDASGRAGLLKRKLGLAQGNAHDINAAWWRVEGRLDPNDWSSDPAWLDRSDPPERWRSTNHLCGPGYWAWMIPLASGAHSIGIVCDGETHPIAAMNTHEKAMDWLREHQPRLATALDDERHPPQDFRFLRDFSYGCKQVFSERWAITGEAGVFADPFYSPGSDFIAISNGYICDLVERDHAGEPVAGRAAVYQQLYLSFYENTLSLYTGQYALFGDAHLMPLKVIWDYTFYWSGLAALYCADRIACLPVLARLRDTFARAEALNAAMQPLLRDWGRLNVTPVEGSLDGRYLDQYRIDWFYELNRALADPLDDDALVARVKANIARLGDLAAELFAHARGEHPHIDDHGLTALLGPAIDDGRAPLLEPFWYETTPAVSAQEPSDATAQAVD